MALNTVANELGGAVNDGSLAAVLKELQGLRVNVAAGAAAGTAMNVAALRTEDTIISALVLTDAGGAAADDTANITIQSTKASGTITISGNPVADETFVVNGVTYTFKAAVTGPKQVLITAGNNTTMATAAAAAINAYENSKVAVDAGVAATSALGVVTVTAVVDGTAGNAITLTEAATNVAVSGAGTLTGGTATGSFKSTTNLTGKSVVLTWFNKR